MSKREKVSLSKGESDACDMFCHFLYIFFIFLLLKLITMPSPKIVHVMPINFSTFFYPYQNFHYFFLHFTH